MSRYGLALVALGLTAIAIAASRGGAVWLLAWAGAAFVAVGVAYLAGRHGVFGKAADGRLHPAAVVILLPFVGFTWLTWRLAVAVSREPATSMVGPALVLARRLRAHEVPAQAELVLDLTAELPEPRGVRGGRRYRCLRILDAGTPSIEAMIACFDAVPAEQCVLIHCAQGHGRTAMVAACLLLHRRVAPTVDDALDRVIAVRPAARVNREQRRFVERFAVASAERCCGEAPAEPTSVRARPARSAGEARSMTRGRSPKGDGF